MPLPSTQPNPKAMPIDYRQPGVTLYDCLLMNIACALIAKDTTESKSPTDIAIEAEGFATELLAILYPTPPPSSSSS